MLYDLAIIGAGPAGLSAAIYSARAQLKTIIFGDPSKGNLYKAHTIANYFGFPKPPTGPELSDLGLQQVLNFGAEHSLNQILDIQVKEDQTFVLKDNLQNVFYSKTIILATGQSFTLSGLKGEKDYTGKGVSYCSTCDGFFFKNKSIVVIGNGDYAAEEALQLLSYTKQIKILSHGKDFDLNQKFRDLLTQNNINLLKTARLAEISGTKDFVQKIISTDGTEYPTEGVFMALGVAGANSFAKKLGLAMEGNYIKINQSGQTNLPGLMAAGDCTGSPAQVAISVGNGCNAALTAIKLVRGLNVYIQYN